MLHSIIKRKVVINIDKNWEATNIKSEGCSCIPFMCQRINRINKT